MKLICEIRTGSHLYGTATESSDEDRMGLFVPDERDILLGRIPKTANFSPRDDTRKNEPGELDATYYSIHHFLRLATQGQTVAIDMLFAPEKNIVFKSEEHGWIWDALVKERHRFLCKKMNAFVGYTRAQASKYSLKGERLTKLKEFRIFLGKLWEEPLGDLDWNQLPKDDERLNPNGIRELQIAGKWFGETTPVRFVKEAVDSKIERYGKRAQVSSDAGGVDWKAMSHAVRVSKELIEILSFGRINFPLADAGLLLKIKKGKVGLSKVQDILDRDLAFIELQMGQSTLPDAVDVKWWDDWLIGVLKHDYEN